MHGLIGDEQLRWEKMIAGELGQQAFALNNK